MDNKEILFEEAEKELEEITSKLENGAVSLSEAKKLYERGSFLVQICAKQVEEVKGKITVIREKIEKLFSTEEN